jgi:hypothetical protein
MNKFAGMEILLLPVALQLQIFVLLIMLDFYNICAFGIILV